MNKLTFLLICLFYFRKMSVNVELSFITSDVIEEIRQIPANTTTLKLSKMIHDNFIGNNIYMDGIGIISNPPPSSDDDANGNGNDVRELSRNEMITPGNYFVNINNATDCMYKSISFTNPGISTRENMMCSVKFDGIDKNFIVCASLYSSDGEIIVRLYEHVDDKVPLKLSNKTNIPSSIIDEENNSIMVYPLGTNENITKPYDDYDHDDHKITSSSETTNIFTHLCLVQGGDDDDDDLNLWPNEHYNHQMRYKWYIKSFTNDQYYQGNPGEYTYNDNYDNYHDDYDDNSSVDEKEIKRNGCKLLLSSSKLSTLADDEDPNELNVPYSCCDYYNQGKYGFFLLMSRYFVDIFRVSLGGIYLVTRSVFNVRGVDCIKYVKNNREILLFTSTEVYKFTYQEEQVCFVFDSKYIYEDQRFFEKFGASSHYVDRKIFCMPTVLSDWNHNYTQEYRHIFNIDTMSVEIKKVVGSEGLHDHVISGDLAFLYDKFNNRFQVYDIESTGDVNEPTHIVEYQPNVLRKRHIQYITRKNKQFSLICLSNGGGIDCVTNLAVYTSEKRCWDYYVLFDNQFATIDTDADAQLVFIGDDYYNKTGLCYIPIKLKRNGHSCLYFRVHF